VVKDGEEITLEPIVEFKPNIQLYNFGTNGIENVDLIIDNKNVNFAIKT
jgi:hypothetical protein